MPRYYNTTPPFSVILILPTRPSYYGYGAVRCHLGPTLRILFLLQKVVHPKGSLRQPLRQVHLNANGAVITSISHVTRRFLGVAYSTCSSAASATVTRFRLGGVIS